jgi:hypothetical protein
VHRLLGGGRRLSTNLHDPTLDADAILRRGAGCSSLAEDWVLYGGAGTGRRSGMATFEVQTRDGLMRVQADMVNEYGHEGRWLQFVSMTRQRPEVVVMLRTGDVLKIQRKEG